MFLSYYYGYLEYERIYSYFPLWYTYVNINNMRIFLNPWYLTMCMIQSIWTIQFYIYYQKGEYTIRNSPIKMNRTSYILINTLLAWCILPVYIINIVYTPITRRFFITPTIINPVIPHRGIRPIDNPVIPQRIISNNNNFHSERPDDCGVCFEKLNETDSKTSCGHYFHHRTCLMTWLITSRTSKCPTCRSELELSNEDLLEIRNGPFLPDAPVLMYNRHQENDAPEPVLMYNNNMFDNILIYMHKFAPRFNYIRDLTE